MALSVTNFFPKGRMEVPVGFDVRNERRQSRLAKAMNHPHISLLDYGKGTSNHEVMNSVVIPWYKRVVFQRDWGWLALLSLKQGDFDGRGIGKSFLASSIFHALGNYLVGHTPNHLYWEPCGKYFRSPTELLEFLQRENDVRTAIGPRIDPTSGEERCRIVVLDDFSEGITGALRYVSAADQERTFQAMLTELFDHLYQERIVLVVTANIDVPQSMMWESMESFMGTSAWGRFNPVTTYATMLGEPNFRLMALSQEMQAIKFHSTVNKGG